MITKSLAKFLLESKLLNFFSLIVAVEIIKSKEIVDLEIIEKLAWEIIPEFYRSIIPEEHSEFFVKKFQSINALMHQINSDNFEYYLLKQKNEYIGYFGIRISSTNQEILLSKLYLLKLHRGSGFGSIAMDFIVNRARELDSKRIFLTVNRNNYKTIDFYKKFSFVVTKELINRFENGHTILDYEMMKTIA